MKADKIAVNISNSFQSAGQLAKRKLKFYFLLSLALAVSWPANAVYSLSPFYANVQSLVYSFIGSVDAKLTGFNSNKMFANGTAAGHFDGTLGIVADPTNDLLYVVDNGNHRIQKFRLSTGLSLGQIGKSSVAAGTCIVGAQTSWCSGGTFVSGNADGEFNSPASIAIDIAGNRLYIADMTNNRIQKFNLMTGAFIGSIGYTSSATGSCISGKQTSWCTGGTFTFTSVDGGFFYPFSLVIDTVHNGLYVFDRLNYKVQKFTLSTGALVGAIGNSFGASGTCISGKQNTWCLNGDFTSATTDGGFSLNGMLAIDTANSFLYVTDGNYRIQKFTLAGAFVGSIGKSTAGGTCVAGKQNGWCTGGTFSVGAADGQFSASIAVMTTDVANNLLYVVDAGNSRVQKFTLSTGAYLGSIGRSSVTAGTCVAGVQTSWCTGGTFESGFGDGAFYSPFGMAIDTVNNRLYVTNNSVGVQRLNLSTSAGLGSLGKVVVPTANWNQTPGDFALNAASFDGAFYFLSGVALDIPNDLFYVTDYSSHRVNKIKISTGQLIGVIGNSLAIGTCVSGKQNGWCLGGLFSAASGDGQFNNPNAVAIDTVNDRLFVGDSFRVQKFVLSTGAYVGTIGNSTLSGTCIAGKQTAWCTGGTFSALTADGTFNSVNSVGVDVTNNRMYVMDSFGYRVQRFNLSTGAFLGSIGKSTAAGTCAAGAQATWCTGGTFSTGGTLDGGFNLNGLMTLDTANDRFYVTDRNYGRVQKFILSSGAFVGTIGNSTAATGTCVVGKQSGWCTGGTYSAVAGDGTFASPKAVLTDTGRNLLFVTDQLAGTIQKFKLSTGAYIGTIGLSTVKAGTCSSGAQKLWCVGGTFKTGAGAAEFSSASAAAIDSTNQRLFILDQSRIIKIRNY